MPFQAATSQPQMLNTYHMPREYAHVWRSAFLTGAPVPDGYGHNLAYGQPYVLQQPQQPQAQQHPQQQQPGPQRGHPIPSPSPVNASNAGMIIQVQESGAKAVPPPHIPNAAAAPFKPREKKIAVLQDPNTMEIVDLVKPAAADSAPPATSQRSTPSVDSVKADTAADVPIPEPAKNLPNVRFRFLINQLLLT